MFANWALLSGIFHQHLPSVNPLGFPPLRAGSPLARFAYLHISFMLNYVGNDNSAAEAPFSSECGSLQCWHASAMEAQSGLVSLACRMKNT